MEEKVNVKGVGLKEILRTIFGGDSKEENKDEGSPLDNVWLDVWASVEAQGNKLTNIEPEPTSSKREKKKSSFNVETKGETPRNSKPKRKAKSLDKSEQNINANSGNERV